MEKAMELVGASESATSTPILLPMVYRELRQLACARLRKGGLGQTLQATALVHEVYLRLLRSDGTDISWKNRAHFLCAASEAMRRIVIDLYRRKHSIKRGGSAKRIAMDLDLIVLPETGFDMLAINDALEELELVDPQKALLVKLRFFCGMTMTESAAVLEVSLPTAERYWRYARAFLAMQIQDS